MQRELTGSPVANIIAHVVTGMACGAWVGVILWTCRCWNIAVVVGVSLVVFCGTAWVSVRSWLGDGQSAAVLGRRLFADLALCVLILGLGYLLYTPCWSWFPEGMIDIDFVSLAYQLSASSESPHLDIFPNFWVIWTGIFTTLYQGWITTLWFWWALALTGTIIFYIRSERSFRETLMVVLLFMSCLPLVVSAKVALPSISAGILFWSGLLCLQQGQDSGRILPFIQAALCFREAVFQFFPFEMMIVALPLLYLLYPAAERVQRFHIFWFSIVLLLSIAERFLWLAVADHSWGVNHLLFSESWIPDLHLLSLQLVLVLFLLLLVAIRSNPFFRRTFYPGKNVFILLFAVVLGALVQGLFFFSTQETRFFNLLFQDNPALLGIFFCGSIGLCLWISEAKKPLRLWCLAILLFQVTLLPGLFQLGTDITRLTFVVPMIIPLIFVGSAVFFQRLTEKLGNNNWSWLITAGLFGLSLSQLPPSLFYSWGDFQYETVFRLVKSLPPDSQIVLNKDEADLLPFFLRTHSGPIQYLSQARLRDLDQIPPGKDIFGFNIPSESLFKLNNLFGEKKDFGRYYYDPFPLNRSYWNVREYTVEKLVPAVEYFRSRTPEMPFSFILDLGTNDRGYIQRFHKRARTNIDLVYRWSTHTSLFKMPTPHKGDYTLTFATVDSYYPQNLAMCLEVYSERGTLLGTVTKTNKSVQLSKSEVSIPFTRFRLSTKTFRPGRLRWGGVDMRFLGVALNKIGIRSEF